MTFDFEEKIHSYLLNTSKGLRTQAVNFWKIIRKNLQAGLQLWNLYTQYKYFSHEP